jgi:hypothetical protein
VWKYSFEIWHLLQDEARCARRTGNAQTLLEYCRYSNEPELVCFLFDIDEQRAHSLLWRERAQFQLNFIPEIESTSTTAPWNRKICMKSIFSRSSDHTFISTPVQIWTHHTLIWITMYYLGYASLMVSTVLIWTVFKSKNHHKCSIVSLDTRLDTSPHVKSGWNHYVRPEN